VLTNKIQYLYADAADRGCRKITVTSIWIHMDMEASDRRCRKMEAADRRCRKIEAVKMREDRGCRYKMQEDSGCKKIRLYKEDAGR
jgi:hypothetical protein